MSEHAFRPGSASSPVPVPVWAVYTRRTVDDHWQLAAVSVVSEARARDLADQDAAARRPRGGSQAPAQVVRRFPDLRQVPWALDDSGVPAVSATPA
jgi:hypothetical protein